MEKNPGRNLSNFRLGGPLLQIRFKDHSITVLCERIDTSTSNGDGKRVSMSFAGRSALRSYTVTGNPTFDTFEVGPDSRIRILFNSQKPKEEFHGNLRVLAL